MSHPGIRLAATPAQIEILQSPARTKVLICGRRWGKSLTQALFLASTACAHPNGKTMYLAPSYARSMSMYRMMRRAKGFRRIIRHAHAQFPPRLELINGHEIWFRSADQPTNLLGEGMVGIAMDEAARLPESLWFETCKPMLADTGGMALLATTYCGRNWLWKLGEDGKKPPADPTRPALKTWVYPTATGLRFTGPEGAARYAELISDYPPSVREQEFECLALATADAVFRDVDGLPTCATLARGVPGRAYVIGLDLGRVRDPEVAVVLDAESLQQVHALQFPRGLAHGLMARKVAELREAFNGADIIVDVTGGATGGHGTKDTHVEFYRRELPGLREFNWTSQNKKAIISALALALEERRISIPREGGAMETRSQLSLYSYRMSSYGHVYYSAPQGEHDDHVQALAMAYWAVRQGWVSAAGRAARPAF